MTDMFERRPRFFDRYRVSFLLGCTLALGLASCVNSGETARIHTLTHAGATQDEEPVAYLEELGVPREEVLDDVLAFWADRDGRPREGRSGHLITGPIYVEGASPGDMLEIQILDIETRTIATPRAENDTHYLITGIDVDLDRATRNATWEVVNFLVEEKRLTPAEALSIASIAVDFRVSEVVDLT